MHVFVEFWHSFNRLWIFDESRLQNSQGSRSHGLLDRVVNVAYNSPSFRFCKVSSYRYDRRHCLNLGLQRMVAIAFELDHISRDARARTWAEFELLSFELEHASMRWQDRIQEWLHPLGDSLPN